MVFAVNEFVSVCVCARICTRTCSGSHTCTEVLDWRAGRRIQRRGTKPDSSKIFKTSENPRDYHPLKLLYHILWDFGYQIIIGHGHQDLAL